ncbi:unnamed protein product [Moneuplotes crassus]|uniref:Uncharacterized protein n=1 Tax=Euplotes crassus TaxID=5936 RepID=A0AAD1Y6X7_EUPCR|nr:unnamed protein product [Moneuplotes crassus]
MRVLAKTKWINALVLHSPLNSSSVSLSLRLMARAPSPIAKKTAANNEFKGALGMIKLYAMQATRIRTQNAMNLSIRIILGFFSLLYSSLTLVMISLISLKVSIISKLIRVIINLKF